MGNIMRGGSRVGAGRKSVEIKKKTVVIRVDVDLLPAIQCLKDSEILSDSFSIFSYTQVRNDYIEALRNRVFPDGHFDLDDPRITKLHDWLSGVADFDKLISERLGIKSFHDLL